MTLSTNDLVVEMLNDFGGEVVARAQRNIGAIRVVGGKRRRIDSSGKLRKSLTFSLRNRSGVYDLTFKAKGDAAVYANVVEEGRAPGKRQPPVDAILQWMKDKPIRLRSASGFVKTTEAKKRAVAFLIARKIGKEGTEGTHYMRDAYLEELQNRGDEFIVALEAALDNAIDNAKKKLK
jgi:hypothetical protein